MLSCLYLLFIVQVPNDVLPEHLIDLPELDFGDIFDERDLQLFDVDQYLLNYFGEAAPPVLAFDINAWLNTQLKFPERVLTIKPPEFQRTMRYGDLTFRIATRFFPDAQDDPKMILDEPLFRWFGNLSVFYRGLELRGSYRLTRFDPEMWQYSLRLRRNF